MGYLRIGSDIKKQHYNRINIINHIAHAIKHPILGLSVLLQSFPAKNPFISIIIMFQENIHGILQKEIGIVFTHVLEDAGVYKCTTEGREAFMRFLETL